MKERWKDIEYFPGYQVSNHGRIRTEKTGRILVSYPNQYGVFQVGMVQRGIQKHRSVPLLVAKAFIRSTNEAFDTPINLDGDRSNNQVDNLRWRPRWFAIKYNWQFKYAMDESIEQPILDVKTGEVSANSLDCAMKYGLLETDIIGSILNNTVTWPTYQEFVVIEE